MSSRSYASGAFALTAAAALILAGCGGGGKDDQPAARQTEQHAAGDGHEHGEMAAADEHAAAETTTTTAQGGPLTVGGVSFAPPAGWEDLGPSGMRQGQYRFGPVASDPEAAEVNVFYFGSTQGGDVESNLQRWVGQIQGAAADPERMDFEIDGMTAHRIALEGAYSGGMGGPMGGGGELKQGYRLVGVVVEAPQGNVFFKLTGPVSTAKAMEDELMVMVRNVRRAV